MNRSHSGALLRLTPHDRAGLEWVKNWARTRLTRLKVRRKYQPRGGFSEEEMEMFRALIQMEAAAKTLLDGKGKEESDERS